MRLNELYKLMEVFFFFLISFRIIGRKPKNIQQINILVVPSCGSPCILGNCLVCLNICRKKFKVCPFCLQVPAFETSDGKVIFDSNAIAFAVANEQLRGKTPMDQAFILQWISFAGKKCWVWLRGAGVGNLMCWLMIVHLQYSLEPILKIYSTNCYLPVLQYFKGLLNSYYNFTSVLLLSNLCRTKLYFWMILF